MLGSRPFNKDFFASLSSKDAKQFFSENLEAIGNIIKSAQSCRSYEIDPSLTLSDPVSEEQEALSGPNLEGRIVKKEDQVEVPDAKVPEAKISETKVPEAKKVNEAAKRNERNIRLKYKNNPQYSVRLHVG